MARVLVGTTATRLDTDRSGRYRAAAVLIRCPAADIWVDTTSGVAQGSGYQLPAGQPLTANLTDGDALYAVAANAGTDVHVLRLG